MVKAGKDAVYQTPSLKMLIVTPPEQRRDTNFFRQRLDPDFSGREEVFQKIASESLKQNTKTKCPILVLYGLPGMGKTQIALHYADRNRGHFSQVWVIDCRSEITQEQQYRKIAEKLGLSVDWVKDPIQLRRIVHTRIEDGQLEKPWLLILDNVDQPLTEEYLPRKGGYVLITTTEQNICPHTHSIEKIDRMSQLESDPTSAKYYRKGSFQRNGRVSCNLRRFSTSSNFGSKSYQKFFKRGN